MLDALVTEARLRFGLDPADGLQVVAAERLIATPIEASRPVLVVPAALLRGGAAVGATGADAEPPRPLPGRHGPRGRDPLAVLTRLYPADHPVGRFGSTAATTVGALTASDLEAPAYLAPVAPELAVAGPWAMPAISDRLRAPDGCPWDREQTHQSLRKHLLEEAYEVYDALEGGATPDLAGELGDLLLQVILHAQLAAEADVFDLADVQAALATKIVRRHPHVFGEAEARTASDVNRQWERIKAQERADDDEGAGGDAGPRGALDGISPSLPALAASQEMQERAANLGYDWPSLDGVLDKVIEETDELACRGRRRRCGRVGRGVRRSPVRARQRRPQAGRRCGGRDARGQRQVPTPLRQRRASGGGPWCRPARPGLPGARCAVGCRQGGGEDQPMTIGNRPPSVRSDGRGPRDLRPVSFQLGVQKWAEGSCLVRFGDTQVLCAASISDRVPPHLRGKGTGWVTAEYSMLPRATAERSDRESAKGRIGGRTHEIQRLIGRSLRGVVDLNRLGERTITIDCDVLQADGGTRTASITGGYVALGAALITYGMDRLLVGKVAAVSVGIVNGLDFLDLDYSEDSTAEVDMNVVGTDAGTYMEIQGTAEGKAFDRAASNRMLDLADEGLARLFEAQAQVLATVRTVRPAAGRPRLLVATRSEHKLRELRELLRLPDGVLVSLDDLGVEGEPVEDGETFETNAAIKARFGLRATGLPTLADDSGIEVDALGGAPGRPDAALRRRGRDRRRQQPQAARGPGRLAAGAAWRTLRVRPRAGGAG